MAQVLADWTGGGRSGKSRPWLEWLRRLIDWRPPRVVLPRRRCHFIRFDLRGAPARARANSIRLQLLQLTGLPRTGFAFQVVQGQADVWYWDESQLSPATLSAQQGVARPEVAPWPENLLRRSLADGLHLLELREGCEAIALKNGRIACTRWFPGLPDTAGWQAFLRDAGSPLTPRPVASRPAMLPVPLPGWTLHTTLRQPISAAAWGVAAVVALLGALVLAVGIYQIKLERAIGREQAAIDTLSRENAGAIALQQEIEEHAAYLGQLQQARPKAIQLRLMARLAASGLVAADTRINLLEWEYRNNQLRLLFAVPAEGFALRKFLADLEALGLYKDIHLLPDSPPNTVGVRGTLAPEPEKTASGPIPPTPAVPAEASAVLGADEMPPSRPSRIVGRGE